MDRPALLDTRIMDLVPKPGGDYRYAEALASIQAWTYVHSGHMLAYADEYVWRRLKAWHDYEGLPDVRIRCMHCYAVASLRDWARSAHWNPVIRAAQVSVDADPAARRRLRFLDQCDGAKHAKAILGLLWERTEAVI